MHLSRKAKLKIKNLIGTVIQKYLSKAIGKPEANSGNPFIVALLNDFEPLIHRIHGLKTSLGSELEKIAEIIAIDVWGEDNIKRNVKVNIRLPKNVFQTIDSIINNLSNAKTLSEYDKEKGLIEKACENPSKGYEEHTYEFDLILFDQDKKHTYILEMKGPDPNTTEVPGAKKRLLTAFAWKYFETKSKKIDSRLAIYYNNKHPNPYKNPKVHYYFNPKGGIIVQDEFWNFLGKNSSTYIELTNLFRTYGSKNKEKIWIGFSKLININNGIINRTKK